MLDTFSWLVPETPPPLSHSPLFSHSLLAFSPRNIAHEPTYGQKSLNHDERVRLPLPIDQPCTAGLGH